MSLVTSGRSGQHRAAGAARRAGPRRRHRAAARLPPRAAARPSASDFGEVAQRAPIGQHPVPVREFHFGSQRQRADGLHLDRAAGAAQPRDLPRLLEDIEVLGAASPRRRPPRLGRGATAVAGVEVSSSMSTRAPRRGRSCRRRGRGPEVRRGAAGRAVHRRRSRRPPAGRCRARSRRQSRPAKRARGLVSARAVRIGRWSRDGAAADDDVAARVRAVQHRRPAPSRHRSAAAQLDRRSRRRLPRQPASASPPCARTCTTHSIGPVGAVPDVQIARSAAMVQTSSCSAEPTRDRTASRARSR